MIPEIDIWRVATLMLKRYGDEAMTESARRSDELAGDGDVIGARLSGAGSRMLSGNLRTRNLRVRRIDALTGQHPLSYTPIRRTIMGGGMGR